MTYEQILALTEANSKAIEANSKTVDKLSESVAGLSAAQDRNDKAIDKLIEKSDAAQVRWDNFMKRYGGYVDNESRKTENFFIEGLKQLGLIVGTVEFDEIIPNAQRWRKKVVAVELDALLINGTTVGILEVKSTLHINDVVKVRDELISKFRDYYPEYRDKQLAVIVAGELINSDAAELAHELGYILLQPNNQGISVDASCYRAV